MSFSHPDQAVRDWHRADEASRAATRSIAAHGRDYDFFCPRCRRHKTVSRYSSDERAMVLRCARCGLPRPWKDSYVLGGHAHSGRGGLPPRAMLIAGDMALVKKILEELELTPYLPPGCGRIYMAYVVSGRSEAWVAIDSSQKQVEGRSWSIADVRRAIRVSRSWLVKRLKHKGLFRPARVQTRGVG